MVTEHLRRAAVTLLAMVHGTVSGLAVVVLLAELRAVRRAAMAAAMTVAALVASLGLVATPASAHTLDDAVRSSSGCGWSSGSYQRLDSEFITNGSHEVLGMVYLLWHGGRDENCVVTRKLYDMHGVATWTYAWLDRQGLADDSDEGIYGHYAAVALWAGNVCVRYWGIMRETPGGKRFGAGRSEWGNCG